MRLWKGVKTKSNEPLVGRDISGNPNWQSVGNAVDSWFSETKLGIWFYDKVADICGSG